MIVKCPTCRKPTTQLVLAEHGRCAACVRDSDPELKRDKELAALADAERAAAEEEAKRRASPKELVQQELARRELARRHLLPFVKRFNESYDAGWVHRLICDELEAFEEAVVAGKSPRLIIEIPPRHGKSELVSRMFPAWFLGRNPKLEVIAASHTTSLAMDFSRKVRSVFRSEAFGTVFRDARISDDSQAAEHWRTSHGGGYTAVGVGSAVVGKGATCIRHDCDVNTDWYNSTAISNIRVGDYVLGFDHATGRVRPARVRAISASVGREAGTRIGALHCTSDHRLFVPGRGYVAAGACGDTTPLYALAPELRGVRRRLLAEIVRSAQEVEDAEQPVLLRGLLEDAAQPRTGRPRRVALPSVRRAESESAGSIVLGVLQRGAEYGRTVLRRLFPRVQPTAERGGESRATGLFSRVLFAGLREDCVDPSRSGGPGQNVRSVPPVRDTYAPDAAQVLFPRVLYRLARWPAARVRLRGRIQNGILQAAAQEAGLRDVRGSELPERGTSSGRKPGKQRTGQSDATVHAVSQVTSSNVGVCAADLVHALGCGSYVVDLQTDTENFFAEGILVHNCLLIDDPVSGSEDAESFNAREAIKNWYQTEAYTRLAPGGGVMIIMQRWHDEDLSGWLQSRAEKGEGEGWKVVRFSAIAEEDEPYRKKGEPLHPSRYSLELLNNIRRNMTPRQWEALYQQRPVPDDGAYFLKEFFRFYDPADLPPLDQLMVYSTWDLAIGQNEQNDYTAGFTAGLSATDDIYILDHHHGRWDAMEMVEMVLDDQKRWGSQIVGLEKGHIQMTLGPFLNKRMAERRQMGFLLHPLAVGRRDKQSRARSIQGRMQQGRVHWPRNAPWLAPAMRELMRFPNAQHDDRADALGHLGLLLDEMAPKRQAAPKQEKSWVDRLTRFKSSNQRSAMSA